ncbi:MAG: hypothetical protein JWM20_92 [Patescibacteria group bacterium]|nr:hypothetical protein [Patescibacteria group bacterium]
MVFAILIVIGIIGIVGTLWLSGARVRATEFPVEPGHEWFAVPEDVFETSLAIAVKKRFRSMLKVILLWSLEHYRRVSREITIKQVVKAKVRKFLTDHDHLHPHAPSEFLKTVKRETAKRITRKPRAPKIVQAPQEEAVIEESENIQN